MFCSALYKTGTPKSGHFPLYKIRIIHIKSCSNITLVGTEHTKSVLKT